MDCLSLSVEAIEGFWEKFGAEIQHLSRSASTQSFQLSDIATTIKELKRENSHLEKMCKRYKHIAKGVSELHLSKATE